MRYIKASPYNDWSTNEELTCLELMERMPSFMLVMTSVCCFPSLDVLNDLFSKCEQNDGMSGSIFWEEFKISEEERQNLKAAISEKYDINFKENEILDPLVKYNKWFSQGLGLCNQ